MDTPTPVTTPPSPAVAEAQAAVEESRERLAATVRTLRERTDVRSRASRCCAR